MFCTVSALATAVANDDPLQATREVPSSAVPPRRPTRRTPGAASSGDMAGWYVMACADPVDQSTLSVPFEAAMAVTLPRAAGQNGSWSVLLPAEALRAAQAAQMESPEGFVAAATFICIGAA